MPVRRTGAYRHKKSPADNDDNGNDYYEDNDHPSLQSGWSQQLMIMTILMLIDDKNKNNYEDNDAHNDDNDYYVDYDHPSLQNG